MRRFGPARGPGRSGHPQGSGKRPFRACGATRAIGSPRKAVDLVHQAVTLQRVLAAEPDAGARAKLTLLELLLVQGQLQQVIGDHLAAFASLEETVRVGEELVGTSPSRDARQALGRVYLAPSSIYSDMSRIDNAIESNHRAADILQKAVDEGPQDLDANALANTHFRRGYLLFGFMNKAADALQRWSSPERSRNSSWRPTRIDRNSGASSARSTRI